MNVRYWIQPGTDAFVSLDGGHFEPHTTTRDLFFEQPIALTPDAMIFADGTWRIQVAKVLVQRYRVGEQPQA